MPPCSLAASIAAFRMPQTLRAAIHWAVPSLPLPKHSLPPCPAPGRPLMPQPCRLHPSQQTKPGQTKPSPGPGQPPVPHGTVKAHPLLQTGRHPQPHTFLHRRRGRGGTSSAARPRAPSPPARTQQACKRRQVIPSSSPAPSSTIRPAPDKRHSATPPVLHVPRDDGLQTLLSPPAGFGPTLPAGILAASPLQRWHASIFFFLLVPFHNPAPASLPPEPPVVPAQGTWQRAARGRSAAEQSPSAITRPGTGPGPRGAAVVPSAAAKSQTGGKKKGKRRARIWQRCHRRVRGTFPLAHLHPAPEHPGATWGGSAPSVPMSPRGPHTDEQEATTAAAPCGDAAWRARLPDTPLTQHPPAERGGPRKLGRRKRGEALCQWVGGFGVPPGCSVWPLWPCAVWCPHAVPQL